MGKVIGVLLGLIVAVVCFAALGSFYKVDEGERAVLLTNGRVASVEGPGLHFKVPFFQKAVKITLRQQVVYWVCPAEAKSCETGTRRVMEAYSKDSQPADLRVTVNWRVMPGKEADFYSRYGGDPEVYETQTVARVVPEALKEIFGQYTAYTVIADRAAFNTKVSDAVTKAIGGVAQVDSVQVEDIAFSPAFEAAIDDRMKAEVSVQRQQQELAREKVSAEIAVTQAKARADSRKAEADAAAYAVKQEGEAQAAAIRARAAALADNPSLVELTKAERWDGKLPTTMLPNSTVPFVDAGVAR